MLYASAAEVVIIPAAAYVADRFGRRPVLFAGLLGCLLAGAGLFTNIIPWQQALLLCLCCHGIILGGMGAVLISRETRPGTKA